MVDHLRPVMQLPEAYRPMATLDLARDRRTRLLLGLAEIPLLIIFGALFIATVVALSPQRELILTGAS